MHFREAIPADIPQMSAVRLAVKENTLSNPALVTETDYLDHISRRGKGWVCEIEDRVAAFAIVSLADNNIWALFVLPGYEGRGIGSRLHKDMLNWYFKQTSTTVWLSTAAGTRAEMFYRNAGWRDAGNYSAIEIKFEMSAAEWKALSLTC
ncbi:MAG: GNAT family N-acetyltransferase [Dinghuibacter sp.]|nr:GNAT family N-acetyltransferase [Dinghuibacter sp.]